MSEKYELGHGGQEGGRPRVVLRRAEVLDDELEMV